MDLRSGQVRLVRRASCGATINLYMGSSSAASTSIGDEPVRLLRFPTNGIGSTDEIEQGDRYPIAKPSFADATSSRGFADRLVDQTAGALVRDARGP